MAASTDKLDGVIPDPHSALALAEAAKDVKIVQMFTANVKTQSGKLFQVVCPVDMTDEDVFDLIMEIAKNLNGTARNKSAVSRLVVATGPLSSRI